MRDVAMQAVDRAVMIIEAILAKSGGGPSSNNTAEGAGGGGGGDERGPSPYSRVISVTRNEASLIIGFRGATIKRLEQETG